MRDRTIGTIIGLLMLGLVSTTIAVAQLAPDAPAPVAPSAPTSPGGGGAGGAEGDTERETIQPLPPAPQTETTTTTIPYTAADCVSTATKPIVKVVPQLGVRPSLDGRLADYAFPEANQGGHNNHNYWTATIGFEVENGKCLREGGLFYMTTLTPQSGRYAAWEDFALVNQQVTFYPGGYFAELKFRIYDNDDDRQHQKANSASPQHNSAHLVGSRPGCVEFVEFVPVLKKDLTGHKLADQNKFGGIDAVLVAIVGNMPWCEGRH